MPNPPDPANLPAPAPAHDEDTFVICKDCETLVNTNEYYVMGGRMSRRCIPCYKIYGKKLRVKRKNGLGRKYYIDLTDEDKQNILNQIESGIIIKRVARNFGFTYGTLSKWRKEKKI